MFLLMPTACYCLTTMLKLKSKGSVPSLWKLYLEWLLIHILNLPLMLFFMMTEGMMLIFQPFMYAIMVFLAYTSINKFNQFRQIYSHSLTEKYLTEKFSDKKKLILTYIVMTACQIGIMATVPKLTAGLVNLLYVVIYRDDLSNSSLNDWEWYSYSLPLIILYSLVLPLRLRYEPIEIPLSYRVFDLLFVNIVGGLIFIRIKNMFNQYIFDFPSILPILAVAMPVISILFFIIIADSDNNRRPNYFYLFSIPIIEAAALLFPLFFIVSFIWPYWLAPTY